MQATIDIKFKKIRFNKPTVQKNNQTVDKLKNRLKTLIY